MNANLNSSLTTPHRLSCSLNLTNKALVDICLFSIESRKLTVVTSSFSINLDSHSTEIHKSSLEKAEYILNRPITKFYNRDDVNATAAELPQILANEANIFVNSR